MTLGNVPDECLGLTLYLLAYSPTFPFPFQLDVDHYICEKNACFYYRRDDVMTP